MTHILIAGRLHPAGITRLTSAPGVTYQLVDEISVESYAPFVADADAVVLRTQPMTADIIATAARLKVVSRHGVGYDAVDVKALSARGIALTIVGDVNSRAVAEHTLMLMLSTARHTVAHDRAARSGHWNIRNRFETVELDGKTLLLLGFGRIGRRVAQLAHAFGMVVTAYDPYLSAEAIAAAGVRPAPDVTRALGAADFVSLHMPPSPKGPLIGASELALMKPSAILINAARGGLVDEAALDEALKGNRLLAAGIDVLAEEPPKPDNALLANERVTISPHSAGLTEECAARMAVASVQNILDLFAGTIDKRLIVNAADIATENPSSHA